MYIYIYTCVWYGHPSQKTGNPCWYVNPDEYGLMTIPQHAPPMFDDRTCLGVEWVLKLPIKFVSRAYKQSSMFSLINAVMNEFGSFAYYDHFNIHISKVGTLPFLPTTNVRASIYARCHSVGQNKKVLQSSTLCKLLNFLFASLYFGRVEDRLDAPLDIIQLFPVSDQLHSTQSPAELIL